MAILAVTDYLQKKKKNYLESVDGKVFKCVSDFRNAYFFLEKFHKTFHIIR